MWQVPPSRCVSNNSSKESSNTQPERHLSRFNETKLTKHQFPGERASAKRRKTTQNSKSESVVLLCLLVCLLFQKRAVREQSRFRAGLQTTGRFITKYLQHQVWLEQPPNTVASPQATSVANRWYQCSTEGGEPLRVCHLSAGGRAVSGSSGHSCHLYTGCVRALFGRFGLGGVFSGVQGLEQAEEAGGLADAAELDAEGLHLDEQVLHVDYLVSDQRLQEDADQAHQAVLQHKVDQHEQDWRKNPLTPKLRLDSHKATFRQLQLERVAENFTAAVPLRTSCELLVAPLALQLSRKHNSSDTQRKQEAVFAFPPGSYKVPLVINNEKSHAGIFI